MNHSYLYRSSFVVRRSHGRTWGTENDERRTQPGAAAAQIPAPSLRQDAILWLSTTLLIVLAAAVAGCGGGNGDAQDANAAASSDARAVRVETLVLEPTPFEDVIRITGAVSALDDATLSAQAAGTVTALARLGTYVAAGGSVAQLNPTMAGSSVAQAKAQVEAAQASFDLAADNLKRQEPLYRDSVISAIEWENVRAQYNQARAGLAQAEAALAQAQEVMRQTRVTTPFGGTVEEHFVELGEQVTPGRQVARIINTSRVKVTAGVPERYAADVAVGTPVLLDFQAYRGQPIRSQVSFVGSAIDPDSRTFPIEVVVENSEGRLKPQMIANVSVTRQEIENALVVPRSAVLRTEDGNIVYVVRRDGNEAVAERRDVILGSAQGGNVIVTNLQAGDEVIVLGQNNITEGDPVQVMERHDAASAVSDTTAIPQPQSE